MGSEHEDNHGKTVAAWTAVIVMLVGSTISSIAVLMASPLIFWVGIVVCALGGVAGLVLRSMGYGQKRTVLHVGGR
jgi:predicted membrane channel-forming protein YqfA (hemolysin III family)